MYYVCVCTDATYVHIHKYARMHCDYLSAVANGATLQDCMHANVNVPQHRRVYQYMFHVRANVRVCFYVRACHMYDYACIAHYLRHFAAPKFPKMRHLENPEW